MKSKIVLYLLTITTIVMMALNTYTIFRRQGLIELRVNNSIASFHDVINSMTPPKDGEQGPQGIQGIQGERGPKGDKGDAGTDSQSTHTTETVIKEVAVNGKDGYTPVKGVDYFDGESPDIRCNESKNRWEKKYPSSLSWIIVRNENGEPAKCKVTPL